MCAQVYSVSSFVHSRFANENSLPYMPPIYSIQLMSCSFKQKQIYTSGILYVRALATATERHAFALFLCSQRWIFVVSSWSLPPFFGSLQIWRWCTLMDKKRAEWIGEQVTVKHIFVEIKKTKRAREGHIMRRQDDWWTLRVASWVDSKGKRAWQGAVEGRVGGSDQEICGNNVALTSPEQG